MVLVLLGLQDSLDHLDQLGTEVKWDLADHRDHLVREEKQVHQAHPVP